MIEMEKKYLVKEIPDLKNRTSHRICQGYLNIDSEPILRIRKYDENYFLTYKFKLDNTSINACTEYELPITEKAYNNLLAKVDGKMVNKVRYEINIQNNLIAELDIFENELKGLKIVEVEFSSEEEAKNFNPPDWFGKDVTKDKKYRNSSLSRNSNIESILVEK